MIVDAARNFSRSHPRFMKQYFPDFETFSRLAGQGDLVPVYRRLVSDTLTPVSAYVRIRNGTCAFLFESVVGGERIGRYSFLGADPFLRINAYGNRVEIHDTQGTTTHESPDPLADLEKRLSEYKAVHLPGLPRFCGGAVGYAGYDTVRYTEHLPNAPHDDRRLPDLSFGFYDSMLVFDQINKTIQVVSHARTKTGDLKKAYNEACRRIDEMCERLAQSTDEMAPFDISVGGEPTIQWKSNFSRDGFEAAVEKCKEYIRAGDIFQVVLSQRLAIETKVTPLNFYRALRVVNPSPFMFFLHSPEVDLVGSSPEIMVRVEDGVVTIRPLAGTRKRGETEE